MKLSGNAKEFQPGQTWGGGGFDIRDHDFPVIGSRTKGGGRGRYWFHEESLNPILKRNIDAILKENDALTSKLEKSQEKVQKVEDRNCWLEWNKKRLNEGNEEHESKISSLEDTIQDHIDANVINDNIRKERENEVDSDLKYFRSRLERTDTALRAVKENSEHKSLVIADLEEKLRHCETDLDVTRHELVEANRIYTQNYSIQRDMERDREKSNEEWIGCTLKMQFIFDSIKKTGALREDHVDWVMGMTESIEIPSVSARMRNQFLPSYEDAHMEDIDSEDEQDRIDEWSREAAIFSDQIGEHISEQLGRNQSSMIKSFITIQKFVRGFILRRNYQYLYGDNPTQRIASATLIQKNYRRFKDRLMFGNSGVSLGCDCETCRLRRERDEIQDQIDEEDDESRLQLAIQLSLDRSVDFGSPGNGDHIMYNLTRIMYIPKEMITDDAPNYDIDVMFNIPLEQTDAERQAIVDHPHPGFHEYDDY